MENEKQDSKSEKSCASPIDIAIVGGGIAGLYCALQCGEKYNGKKAVELFEMSDRFGGRIWTEFFPDKKPWEFAAEFGPMRIEPDHQPCLKSLLDKLQIYDPKDAPKEASKKFDEPAWLINFPPYSSPPTPNEPDYRLSGDEADQKSPLDLLRLAFVRILGRLVVSSRNPHNVLEDRLKCGRDALQLAMASRQPGWKGTLESWIESLTEDDYQLIRAHAEFAYDARESAPLWLMGFWNLMSEVLTHNALARLRDQGSFYHLIDENPNAAEWLIFWLRALKTSSTLKGIHGGMRAIIDRLETETKAAIGADRLKSHTEVTSLKPGDGVLTLGLKNKGTISARRVIFALPKQPLQKIANASFPYFPEDVRAGIDSVFAFPMVKVFVIVKERWWEEENRANFYATSIPTRELHYWKSPISKRGMIMIYTDRPNSAFWANYLGSPGEQTRTESSCVSWSPHPHLADLPNEEEMRERQARRLLRKVAQYVRDNGMPTFKEEDIEWFGIRDWGRDPYGGANHAWRPERKSWEVLTRLQQFALVGEDGKEASTAGNIHICGEAYSDYHGFIEGSLRSAISVLNAIDDTFPKGVDADKPAPRSVFK